MRIVLALLLVLIIGIGVLRPTFKGGPDQMVTAAPTDTARDRVRPREAAARAMGCNNGPVAAATANAQSLASLEFAPFHMAEIGWSIYAPRIAAEIGTTCGPASRGFGAALARWQRAHALAPTGIVDVRSFAAMRDRWTAARPFVAQTQGGDCPAPPPAAALVTAGAGESLGGKTVMLRPTALSAYRRMVAAARRDLPGVVPGDHWLRIFSGFRDPDADTLRCATQGNCQGVARAQCSAHRTGLAMDMDVGAAAGFGPDSADDANRRFMAQTPVYRWLVRNAARYGFVNYVYEPWHWEWLDSGTPPRQ
jgi:hypothetical protein